MRTQYDVIILGGGLAGLTLAMQLKKNEENISIAVLEMRKSIAPESGHKVGESTVELGTYYLREVLGLADYLDEKQLPKLGLRFFFASDKKDKIDHRVELGASGHLPVPSHQIDRGIFENDLMAQLREMGVDIVLGARVKNLEFDVEQKHTVSYSKDGELFELKANWVGDATGRAAVVKRKEGFEKALDHNVNAVWFRVEGEIDVDDWSDNEKWQKRFNPGIRRLGTIHLMGTGYWVWLIPLSSGNTSVGIVADPRFHDYSTFNKFDKAMDWLHKNEPLCGEKLEAYRDKLIDFRGIKHYAHNSDRFYATEKWGVVGEAGAFLDPFYSPGTDFISLGNTWLSDLILRDYRGEDVASRSIIYERVHKAFFNSWVPIYRHQYELYGNTQVMLAKILWDWAVYWAIPCLLFTNNGYTNLEVLRALFTSKNSVGTRLGKLNERVQDFFKEWNIAEDIAYHNYFIDFFFVPFIKRLHLEMEEDLSQEELVARCTSNLEILEQTAVEIFRKTSARLKGTPENMKANPYKMSLTSSKEALLQQAEEKGAIDVAANIVEDLNVVWLNEQITA